VFRLGLRSFTTIDIWIGTRERKESAEEEEPDKKKAGKQTKTRLEEVLEVAD